MDELIQENQKLQQIAHKYQQQIQQLQKTGQQHETEIETLLKFNQKLLGIIQKQLNGQKLKNSQISLQPISQKTQIQSEMFQSQLHQQKMGIGYGKKPMIGRSLNLKPDPIHERLGRPQPLAIIEREQQLSIDIDPSRQRQSQDDRTEMTTFIKQFRKNIKLNGNQYSISDIQKMYKADQNYLRQVKQQANQVIAANMQKLSKLKRQIVELNPKQKLIIFANEQNIQNGTKKYILHNLSIL